MAQLTVFSARACPFAHRTRLALGEKRLEFELVEIDLQNKPTWFKSVSVYGKVPALQRDGHRIVESAIVNEYLEDVFPEPALLPKSPAARAAARQLSAGGPFWFGAELSLVDVAFYPWFERWAALEHYRGVAVPAKLERLARWRSAMSERASVKDIENPTSFYVEGYAKFVQPQRQAASA